MKDLKLLGRYIKKYLLWYLVGLAALFVVDLMNVFIPEYTGKITDGLKDRTFQMPDVQSYCLKIVLMGAVIALGRFLWRVCIFGGSRAIERNVRNDMFGHLEKLSMRYFNEHKTGDLMAHFTNDLNTVRNLLGGAIVTAFDATVMLVMVLWKMIQYVDWKLTLVSIVPLVFIIVGDAFFGKVMHRKYMEKQEAFSDLSDQVQESISGIRVIKAFVQERKELYAFMRTNQKNFDKNMDVVKLQAFFFPIMDAVIGLSGLFTLIYGGRLAIMGDITIGRFIAFNTYVGMLIWPMIAVGQCITQISQGLASVRRVRLILEEEPDIVDTADVKDVDALHGEVEFNDLTFAYPDQEDVEVLEGIRVTVQKGETLAIIGRTGSGKTTIANLMLRLYNTKSDMIRFDGHSIFEIPLSVLRRDIAYVPQDSFLFSDTLENNIAFGIRVKDRSAVQRAAKNACIHENIMEFPQGYETVVGERGVTLSGGQKQRSAIARALLKDAPILILDDALSAVDTDTEEQILRNLKENRRGKTTVIIAHRISTIQDADHILVLDDGRAAEYGTHEELMKLNGIYRTIFDKQQLEKQLQEVGDE